MRFTLTTLLLTTAALAAPVSLPEIDSISLLTRASIAANQSSCIGYSDAFWDINKSIYKITIGRPYLGGGRCPELKSKIGKEFHLSGFKCEGTNNNRNTLITMTSNVKPGNLKKVNKALKAAYPEIAFKCPTALRR